MERKTLSDTHSYEVLIGKMEDKYLINTSQKLVPILEEYNLYACQKKLKKVCKLYRLGVKLKQMAIELETDPDCVALWIMDQASKGNISAPNELFKSIDDSMDLQNE